MPDHVHMLISIPPKYSVAQIRGYMKGKSSIWIAQNVERKMPEFSGPQVLDARILCHDRWPGRGNDSGLHPKPRTGRSAIGAV